MKTTTKSVKAKSAAITKVQKRVKTEGVRTTNIELNENLVSTAMKLSKIKTKKEVVNTALESYVKLLKRVEITKLRGKITFFEGYENQV